MHINIVCAIAILANVVWCVYLITMLSRVEIRDVRLWPMLICIGLAVIGLIVTFVFEKSEGKTSVLNKKQESTQFEIVEVDSSFLRQKGNDFLYCIKDGDGEIRLETAEITNSTVHYDADKNAVVINTTEVLKEKKVWFLFEKHEDTEVEYDFYVAGDRSCIRFDFEKTS